MTEDPLEVVILKLYGADEMLFTFTRHVSQSGMYTQSEIVAIFEKNGAKITSFIGPTRFNSYQVRFQAPSYTSYKIQHALRLGQHKVFRDENQQEND